MDNWQYVFCSTVFEVHLMNHRIFLITFALFHYFTVHPLRVPQMCWSKDVSYATFATGTLLNLAFATLFASFRRYDLVLVLMWWEYGLLMQLPEAAA